MLHSIPYHTNTYTAEHTHVHMHHPMHTHSTTHTHQGVPSTVNGVMGGLGRISSTDIAGSKKFILPFIQVSGKVHRMPVENVAKMIRAKRPELK